MRAGDRSIGAVSASSDSPGRYGPGERDVLTAVLAQATIALEAARLLEPLSEGKHEWEQTVDAIGEAFCVIDAAGASTSKSRVTKRLTCEAIAISRFDSAIGGGASGARRYASHWLHNAGSAIWTSSQKRSYIAISFFGFSASRNSSCAFTRAAMLSSIGPLMNTIRSRSRRA